MERGFSLDCHAMLPVAASACTAPLTFVPVSLSRMVLAARGARTRAESLNFTSTRPVTSGFQVMELRGIWMEEEAFLGSGMRGSSPLVAGSTTAGDWAEMALVRPLAARAEGVPMPIEAWPEPAGVGGAEAATTDAVSAEAATKTES